MNVSSPNVDQALLETGARLARSYIVSLSTYACDVLQRELVEADDISKVFALAWKLFEDLVEAEASREPPAYIEIWSLYDQMCICHITVSEFYRECCY